MVITIFLCHAFCFLEQYGGINGLSQILPGNTQIIGRQHFFSPESKKRPIIVIRELNEGSIRNIPVTFIIRHGKQYAVASFEMVPDRRVQLEILQNFHGFFRLCVHHGFRFIERISHGMATCVKTHKQQCPQDIFRSSCHICKDNLFPPKKNAGFYKYENNS